MDPALLALLGLLQALRARLLLRHLLENDRARAPLPGLVLAGGGGEGRGKLLRLAEVVLNRIVKARAAQLDDALVALGVGALVDGEGDVALAQKLPQVLAFALAFESFRLVVGIAAQSAVGGHVGHHHGDRSIALGLEREDALELQQGAERRRERQHLGEKRGHRLRIGMARQHLLHRVAQLDEAAANAGRLHHEGLDLVG